MGRDVCVCGREDVYKHRSSEAVWEGTINIMINIITKRLKIDHI